MNALYKQSFGVMRLSSRIRVIATVASGLMAWNSIAAPANAPAKKLSYDSYRMVRTRNIFDPDRRAMSLTQAPVRTTESKPVTRSDYVALTGAMVTDDSALAFFSGSRSEYNKVLPVKSSIAGATIVSISADSIVIARDGKQITVAIGQTVPFDSSAPTTAPAPNPASDSGTTPSTSGAAAPSSNMSDVMRRMMERRQKEIK